MYKGKQFSKTVDGSSPIDHDINTSEIEYIEGNKFMYDVGISDSVYKLLLITWSPIS